MNYPKYLYKYRCLGGIAKYEHVEGNTYKDTTCKDHDNCLISVKQVGDHYELDQLLNEEAKRYDSFHKYIKGDSHFYENANDCKIAKIRDLIDYKTKDLIKFKQEFEELRIKIVTSEYHQIDPLFISQLDFDQNIFIVDHDKKHISYGIITHKVFNITGLSYLMVNENIKVTDGTNHEYLSCLVDVEDIEGDIIPTTCYGFLTETDAKNFISNDAYSTMCAKARDLNNSIDILSDKIDDLYIELTSLKEL